MTVKSLHTSMYLDENNLYDAAMSEKLSINGFKWVHDVSRI